MRFLRSRHIRSIGILIILIWVLIAPGCYTFRETDSDAEASFRKQGVRLITPSLLLNGTTLHYAQVGADTLPTLVFVHGSPGSWSAFEHFLMDEDLQHRFRLISIDRPGFGYSNFGAARNLENQSKIISSFLRIIANGKPLYLVGHSLGGPLIVKLGSENRALVSGLVLLSAAVDPKEEQPEKWRPVLIYSPLRFLIPGALRPSNDELWYLKKDLYPLVNDLHSITCPVWILQGEKDDLVPAGNAYYAQKHLSHSSKVELLLFPEANHFIPWTKFQEIKGVLLSLP